MRSIKNLDDIVRVDKEDLELRLINIGYKTNDFVLYDEFLDKVRLYSLEGYRIEYYFDNKKQQYFLLPVKKDKIGFKYEDN